MFEVIRSLKEGYSPPSSAEVKIVEPYLYSSIRLYDMVLN
jgi:hypothetical protein